MGTDTNRGDISLGLPRVFPGRPAVREVPGKSYFTMKSSLLTPFHLALAVLLGAAASAPAFEGVVTIAQNRSGEVQTFRYTVGTGVMRVERGETNWPFARNLIALDTGAITMLFPNNRSFVHLPALAENVAPAGLPAPPPMNVAPISQPGMPASMPPGIPSPPAGTPGGMPAMPMMPMPGVPLELKATGKKTNLLGYVCEKYELQQPGEHLVIWATDQLLPFRPWLQTQPPRLRPPLIEEQWGDLLRDRKLFPLLAILKFEDGAEHLRFEVKAITPEKIADPDGALFQPPPDYREVQPMFF